MANSYPEYAKYVFIGGNKNFTREVLCDKMQASLFLRC
jgi:hypothetical protein